MKKVEKLLNLQISKNNIYELKKEGLIISFNIKHGFDVRCFIISVFNVWWSSLADDRMKNQKNIHTKIIVDIWNKIEIGNIYTR